MPSKKLQYAQFENACQNLDLASVQAINLHSNRALIICCEYGRLDVAKWMVDTNSFLNILSRRNRAFRHACTANNFDLAQWLITIPEFAIGYHQINHLFIDICQRRLLNMAKWLMSNFVLIETSYASNYAIRVAAETNQVEMFKWLHDITPDVENHTYNSLFLHACEVGDLSTVEYLCQLCSGINLDAYGGIYICCIQNNLTLAKYIKYQLQFTRLPDHYYSVSELFIKSYVNNHMEIFDWLMSLIDNIVATRIVNRCYSYNDRLFKKEIRDRLILHLIVNFDIASINSQYQSEFDQLINDVKNSKIKSARKN